MIANNPADPTAQKWASLLAERDQLRQGLTAHGEAVLTGQAPTGLPMKGAATLKSTGAYERVGAKSTTPPSG